MTTNLHNPALVEQKGTPLNEAAAAVILLHGRGGSADDILSLTLHLSTPGVCFLAPQAARNAWYPNSFLAPIAQNQPWLDSALETVRATLQNALDAGIPRDQVIIGGFSQGACLATEFVARNPAKYGGLIALTGGLIGPLESDLTHAGNLLGTPALLASGDPDAHVPWLRVEASATELQNMGAKVDLRRYPGIPHTVIMEELALARNLIRSLIE